MQLPTADKKNLGWIGWDRLRPRCQRQRYKDMAKDILLFRVAIILQPTTVFLSMVQSHGRIELTGMGRHLENTWVRVVKRF